MDQQQNSDTLTHDKLTQRVSTGTAVAYGFGMVPADILIASGIGILQGIYAKYYGLELTVIAGVLLFARLFDAVTDPVIGYLSDGHREKTGSRKPFLLIGGMLVPLCGYYLLLPSPGVSAGQFLFWYMAFYLAWTLFSIPHMSWGSEITTDYDQRARLYAFRGAFLVLGHIVFLALPYLPIFPDNQYTPETFRIAVWLSVALTPLSLLWLWRKVPDGAHFQISNHKKSRESMGVVLKAIIQNRPLLILMVAKIMSGVAIGMWFGVLFIYLDSYLLLGNDIASFFVLGNLCSLASLPFWNWLVTRTSKSSAWFAGMFLKMMMFLLMLLLQPGVAAWVPLIIICVAYLSSACLHVAVPAMVADTVDYGIWKFGQDRAGIYFSFLAFLPKLMASVGPALGLAIAGFYHFDPATTAHSPESIFGLKLAIGAPILFMLIGLVFIRLSPLNKHRHQVIRKRIEQRQQRLQRQKEDMVADTEHRLVEQNA